MNKKERRKRKTTGPMVGFLLKYINFSISDRKLSKK